MRSIDSVWGEDDIFYIEGGDYLLEFKFNGKKKGAFVNYCDDIGYDRSGEIDLIVNKTRYILGTGCYEFNCSWLFKSIFVFIEDGEFVKGWHPEKIWVPNSSFITMSFLINDNKVVVSNNKRQLTVASDGGSIVYTPTGHYTTGIASELMLGYEYYISLMEEYGEKYRFSLGD